MTSVRWTRDQLVVTFEFYCRTPFGHFDQHNSDVIALAQALGRTPSAVAMKLSNFASLDPAEHARGIRGLSGVSQLDREIFSTYALRQDSLLEASEVAAAQLGMPVASTADDLDAGVETDDEHLPEFSGPTEVERTIKVRRAQYAFRRAVMASYESRCAICEIAMPALLAASHIIPWRNDESRRADPTNGLALCALHDRAFDRGFICIDDTARVMISSCVSVDDPPPLHRVGLIDIAGSPLRMPRRFHPDPEALAYHRQNVFAT